jgi:hypothetical protein
VRRQCDHLLPRTPVCSVPLADEIRRHWLKWTTVHCDKHRTFLCAKNRNVDQLVDYGSKLITGDLETFLPSGGIKVLL